VPVIEHGKCLSHHGAVPSHNIVPRFIIPTNAHVSDALSITKPRNLTWEQAAALLLSALTAYEALFDHAGVAVPAIIDVVKHRTKQPSGDLSQRTQTVLITGPPGMWGFLVQLAAIDGLHIVAATSSNTRNVTFLRDLGANEAVEYTTLRGRLESTMSSLTPLAETFWKNVGP
jgi:NADPH:quinone reductase-like Zn-dependent oxidoreductase